MGGIFSKIFLNFFHLCTLNTHCKEFAQNKLQGSRHIIVMMLEIIDSMDHRLPYLSMDVQSKGKEWGPASLHEEKTAIDDFHIFVVSLENAPS